MTRTEFLQFLTRVVRDGLITERRAAELLRDFDKGKLDVADLPVEQEDSDLVPVVLLAISLLIHLLSRLGYSIQQPLVIPDIARAELAETLRIEFQERARALAAGLARSGDVAAWQRGMSQLIKLNMIENAIAGAGRALTAFELSQLGPLAAEQMAFLARFADQIVLGNLTSNPMSEATIAARSELYGRMGLALDSYFSELTAGYGAGWVATYIAIDDRGTCSACHGAQGDYLIGSGPFPAELCFGGMRCRCRREARFDPAAYARLTGERVAA